MTIHPANATFNLPASTNTSGLNFDAMGFAGMDMNSPVAQVQAAAGGNGVMNFRYTMLSRLKGAEAIDTSDSAASSKAQKAAQEFISTALVLPMLKQMRSSAFKSDLFHGGQGEDAFGPQLDQILSDRIVQRMSTPQSISASGSATHSMGLVDAVYKQIMRTSEHHSTRPMKSSTDSASQHSAAPPRVDLKG